MLVEKRRAESDVIKAVSGVEMDSEDHYYRFVMIAAESNWTTNSLTMHASQVLKSFDGVFYSAVFFPVLVLTCRPSNGWHEFVKIL